jgi:hypothetical protein
MTTIFHVRTHDGKWIVTRERRPPGEFDSFETKEEAVERARGEAQRQVPSEVRIHAADGAVERQLSYGEDS